VPVRTPVDPATRRKILDEVRKCGDAKARAVENAARSQDFLLRHRRLAGGIAVDTSALMAIVLGEAEGDGCIAGVDFSKTDLESAL